MTTSLDDIVANFELLDEWDDRYRYLIERGCASQVWLVAHRDGGSGPQTRLRFVGDSDAHIVRGLVALALAIFSGREAAEILATDAFAIYERLGLAAHLTPQRSNGVRAMIDRIKRDAQAAAAA